MTMADPTPEQVEEAMGLVRLLAEAANQPEIYHMRKCLGTDHFEQAKRLIQGMTAPS
jgi:hypothetical protein